jgi:restriction system protein
MEETVGKIFRDLGWDVDVTCYSKDGGIDAIIRKDGSVCGVQIKRYKNNIGVRQIREFSGALVAKKITSGVFVTTSEYTKSALDFPEEAAPEQRIELYDAAKLFDTLRISRTAITHSLEEVFDRLGFQALLSSQEDKEKILKSRFRNYSMYSVINKDLPV